MGNSLSGYLGRFTLVHVTVCTLTALVFLYLQDGLPASQRVALEFFQPYRQPDLMGVVDQVIRGVVLALILWPFYDTVVGARSGRLILFGAVWGLALFGAVEPMPGSIEGMIYTETTWVEHLVVLGAGAVQALLFVTLFLRWEKGVLERRFLTTAGWVSDRVFYDGPWGFVRRFTLLHVLTYWAVGMVFYQVQGYDQAMAAMEVFELYRPLESPVMVAAVFFGQIARGAILALLLYPFYDTFLVRRQGWLLLFLLLWGLTAVGSAIFIPGLTEEIVLAPSFASFLSSMVIGIPEITVQMLVFSWLLFKWERRRIHNSMVIT